MSDGTALSAVPVPSTPAHRESRHDLFLDPAHGPGNTTVTWSPQWVQTTPPPFCTPPQQGYPQPVPQGYPQQGGYGQHGGDGYGQPYGDHHDHGQQQGGGRRFGTGALIGAGAAGPIGGALLNEAFDDDEPDVIVNNYYED